MYGQRRLQPEENVRKAAMAETRWTVRGSAMSSCEDRRDTTGQLPACGGDDFLREAVQLVTALPAEDEGVEPVGDSGFGEVLDPLGGRALNMPSDGPSVTVSETLSTRRLAPTYELSGCIAAGLELAYG
jgi:hypothetical protein